MVLYKDKKEIYFLSTIHKIKMEKLPKRGRDELSPSKLSLVNDYKKYMGGVDRNDALVGNYTCVGKTFKWTVKLVMHFIEEALLNAFILFNKTKPGKARFMNFKMELIETTITRARLDSSKDLYEHPSIGRHFLELVPPTEKKQNPQKRCVECTKKGMRKESRYQCKNYPNHLVCVLLRVLSCIVIDLYINIKKHEHSFVISLFQVNYNVFISFWKRNILPKNTAIFIFLIYPLPQD